MTKIVRNLPNDQYEAAINADNPSATNPFLTGESSGTIGVLVGATGESITVNNSNAETDITTNNYDYSIPANELILGDRVRIKAFARYGTGNATRNFQIRFKHNGLTVLFTKAIQLPINQNNQGLWIDAQFAIVAAGALGEFVAGFNVTAGQSLSSGPILGAIIPSVNTKSIDTTINNLFNFSVQWSGGAPSPNNTITFEEITYEKLRV